MRLITEVSSACHGGMNKWHSWIQWHGKQCSSDEQNCLDVEKSVAKIHSRFLIVEPNWSCLHSSVQVEKGAQVAAGAVVAPGTVIPSGELWGGNPAKLLRPLKPDEAAFISKSAQTYAELASQHLKEIAAPQ